MFQRTSHRSICFLDFQAEQRVFPQKIFSNNKQNNQNCSAKTEVREGQRRTARCQNNQSRSNFPNNNNSLPLSVFVFVVGWLGGGRLQRKLEMKGLTAIKLKHQHPSRVNPIIVSLEWRHQRTEKLTGREGEILTNSLVISAHSPHSAEG